MLKDHKDILAALNAHHVKYLVVGGHAVSIHAEPRGTKDLGLFIKADEENSRAVFAALAEYGAPISGMTPADFNDKPTTVFQMGVPPARIDILQGIAGSVLMRLGRTESKGSSIRRHRPMSSRAAI
jgi:hypothetical protein